jgi:hypothetical protein
MSRELEQAILIVALSVFSVVGLVVIFKPHEQTRKKLPISNDLIYVNDSTYYRVEIDTVYFSQHCQVEK